ncbi:MAG: four helix bundle protein [Verrucomicrobiia bacterium]|jgi:four helix bundle protein
MPNDKSRPVKKYDLEERTARFGVTVIAFAKRLPNGPVTSSLISQVVRAATSIGANYAEADDAQSKKEFLQKIGYCRKEARETKHWLRMIATATPENRDTARELWQEAKELHLIFAAICRGGKD